jgi:hypothetical protein
MKKIGCKNISILMTFILILSVFSLSNVLADTEDTNHRVALTLNCNYDNKPLADVTFNLYLVGDMASDNTIDITDEFGNYAVDLAGIDTTKTRELAETLDGYVERDNIRETISGVTDEAGTLTLPQEGSLEEGVYLCVADQHRVGNEVYTIEPFLISLPQQLSNGEYNYDVVVSPKIQATEFENTVDYSVVKVWKDSESEAGTVGSTSGNVETDGKRPSSIEAQLVGDGEVYETVTLNAANNWRHTWEDLDASVEWRVVEKEVPAGYSVVTELENTTFVITNTELTEEPTTEEPTTETTTEVTTERSSQATTEQITETTTEVTTEKITEQVTEATTEVTTYNTTETPTETTTATNKTTETKLPQTGMLRWPIPFLTGAGLLLFVIGWIRYRKYSHGDGVNEKKR